MACSKSLALAQNIAKCALCETEPNIKWRCVDCDFLMCEECRKKTHSKFKFAKYHSVIDIKDIGRWDFTFIKCYNHVNESAPLFCASCQQAVCLSCVNHEHAGHHFTQIKDGYNLILQKLTDKMKLFSLMDKDEARQKYEQLISITNMDLFFTESAKFLKDNSNIQMKVKRRFVTELDDCDFVAACHDGSLWIGDVEKKEVQKVKLEEVRLQSMKQFQCDVYCMKVLSDEEILLADLTPSLKLVNHSTGNIENSKYCASPLNILSLHVTENKEIIVGAGDGDPLTKEESRMVVIVMNQDGHQLKTFEWDSNGCRLFSFPCRLMSVNNNKIFVVDWRTRDCDGLVVVLNMNDTAVNFYTGKPCINNVSGQFRPTCITSTPSDRVIVCDQWDHFFHILDSLGQLLSCISGSDIGVEWPFCMGFSVINQNILYIGSHTKDSSGTKAILCEVCYTEL